MEGVAGEVDGVELGIGDLDPFGVLVPIQYGAHREPSVGRRRRDQLDDRAIGSQWLPRPLMLMNEKRRCSILFHLLVPGGKWQTVMGNLNSLASFCSSTFHSRMR
jgi:hypothetical protein